MSMTEKEIWKDIPGFEGVYQASTLGSVRSLKFPSKKVLKPNYNNQGYAQYTLNGKKYLGNRIIATTFLENPENFLVVHHKDDNPKNNSVSNLQWVSQSMNMMFSEKIKGSKCHCATINEELVEEIFTFSKSMTRVQLCEKFNVSYSIVHKIIRGQSWNHITGLPRERFTKLYKKAA